MKRLYLFLPLPMMLAACGGGGSGPTVTAENTSVATVADAAQAAMKMEPGKWKTDIKIVSMEIPGIPKAQADMMQQQMAKASSSVENCITPEMAAKPPSEMLGGQAGANCVYDKFEMADGKLNAAMTCKPSGGGEIKSTTKGSFSSTAFDLTGETSTSGMPGMPGPVTSKTQVSSKRIGECNAPTAG